MKTNIFCKGSFRNFLFILILFCTHHFVKAQSISVLGSNYRFHTDQWYVMDGGVDSFVVDTTKIVLKPKSNTTPLQLSTYLSTHSLSVYYQSGKYLFAYLTGDLFDEMDNADNSGYFDIIDFVSFGKLSSFNPDDPGFSLQPYLKNIGDYDIDMPEAWDITKGNGKVIVAVLDSRINWQHPDLGMGSDGYENIWKNPGEDEWSDPNDPATGNGIDDDKNGYIDDWKGWSFYDGNNDTRGEYLFHGTMVSGIIGAKTNNGLDIAGIAGGDDTQGVQIMPIALTPDDNNFALFSTDSLKKAIKYSMENGARVLNMSIDCLQHSYLDSIINVAFYDYGCLLIAAAGNDSMKGVKYPASHPKVMCIGGVNDTDRHYISNWDSGKVDLVARALHVYSLSGNDDTDTDDGTSFAVPQVCGVAALIWSINPCLTNQEVWKILIDSADHVYDFNTVPGGNIDYDEDPNHPGQAIIYGHGRLNAYRSLQGAQVYEPEDIEITSNTLIDTAIAFARDVIVRAESELTLKGTVLMKADAKIIVEKNAKLILDGAHITTVCEGMWKGIEVKGSPSQSQSFATHGYVEVKNNAIIENAHLAIQSFGGGIVKVNGAKFKNNRRSIVFGQYLPIAPVVLNKSVIVNAEFICDKGMRDPVYTNPSSDDRLGVKDFISITSQHGILINNCEFTNRVNVETNFSGTGISSYNSRTKITNSEFTGLFSGIINAGYFNPVGRTSIVNNIFSETSRCITEQGQMGAYVIDNTFTLPQYRVKLYGPGYIWGVASRYSGGGLVQMNIFEKTDLDFPTGEYGVLMRNSDILPTLVEKNVFNHIAYGTQTELQNPALTISCNVYDNVNQCWSINPIVSGTLPQQGSNQNDQPQAGNLFNDRDDDELLYRHIRMNDNMALDYFANELPDEALPIYNTNTVNAQEVTGGPSVTSQCESPYDPCGENGFPCYSYLENKADTATDPTIKLQAQLELLKQYADSGDHSHVADYLLGQSGALWAQLLVPMYIDDSSVVDAANAMSLLPTGTDHEVSLVNFYQILLDLRIAGKAIDSLTALDEEYGDLATLAEDTFMVSEWARAIMTLYYDSTYNMDPEQWPSSRMTGNPLVQNKADVSLQVMPNPLSNEGMIEVLIHDNNNYSLTVSDLLGRTVEKHDLVKGINAIPVSQSNYQGSVYFINIICKDSVILTKKMIVIH